MAAGLGNFYRLSQTTMIRGGLPFLAVYLGLTIFLGLPLLFLELGIGQLTQEGIVKSWRVVPFFKGTLLMIIFYCHFIIKKERYLILMDYILYITLKYVYLIKVIHFWN